ncbi:MAG: DUF4292 domain-containing protein [Calditrichaceae bacterium]
MYKFLILTVTIFAVGCSSVQTNIKPDLNKITYRELLQNNVAWQNSITSLSGETRITLDSPQYSGNFSARIAQTGSDSLLIAVTGPFGMNLGKVFLAKNRFVFYNQVMNQFYTGSKIDFEGRNFLQFPLEITELQSVFVAQDKFDVLEKKLFEIRDNAYYLEAANGEATYHIWFDAKTNLIRRVEFFQEGQLIYYKEYDKFNRINNTYFPMAINFVRPDEKQGISIYFSSLDINKPVDHKLFDIKISDNASQIDLSLEN